METFPSFFFLSLSLSRGFTFLIKSKPLLVIMAALSVWFWNERFWLPHNVTWADLADPAPGVEYPKAGHLLSALPLAVGIFAVRILFERYALFSFSKSCYHDVFPPSCFLLSTLFLKITLARPYMH